MNIIELTEEKIAEGVAWVKAKAIALYDSAAPIFEGAWQKLEAFTIQDLWGAVASFIQSVLATLGGKVLPSLADLETAFLNAVQTLKTNWLPALEALGSNLLQTLLGLIAGHAQAAA